MRTRECPDCEAAVPTRATQCPRCKCALKPQTWVYTALRLCFEGAWRVGLFAAIGAVLGLIIVGIAVSVPRDQVKPLTDLAALALLILAITSLYCIPAIVAGSRRHRDSAPIIILNLLAGWTVVCWIIALVWASWTPESMRHNQL